MRKGVASGGGWSGGLDASRPREILERAGRESPDLESGLPEVAIHNNRVSLLCLVVVVLNVAFSA